MVIIREDRCIGCWTCTVFCPFGAIYPWPERKIALKCDRCNYMEYPVCVDVCPTKALELIDMDAYEHHLREKRRSISEQLAESRANGICLLDLEATSIKRDTL